MFLRVIPLVLLVALCGCANTSLLGNSCTLPGVMNDDVAFQDDFDECGGDIERFGELAMRHSECPTAMQEGRLGRIKPGQLYPELDRVAFAMKEGAFSEIIESPMGFHILYCECCHPPHEKGLDEVREQLREHLHENKRRQRLRTLLSQ